MEEIPDYISYRIPAPPEFEEVFSHFYIAENTSGETIRKTLLPSFQTILVFSFGSEVTLATKENSEVAVGKCLVIGPVKKAFDYTLASGASLLVENLRDDAFYRFFGTAAMAGQMLMHPDELLQESCFALLWKELYELKDTESRVQHLLEFCRPYIRARGVVAEQLLELDDPFINPIKAVAEMTRRSERSIQMDHKKLMGYTAKEISRYQRFLRAVQMIGGIALQGAKVDWFEIISECGYYDQSQLIHDFTYYLNLSPTRYLKFQQDVCNPVY